MSLNPFRARRERQARETAEAVLMKAIDELRAVLLRPVVVKIDGKTVATAQIKAPYVPSDDGDDGWTLPAKAAI